MDTFIQRRLEFLIAEANAGERQRQDISMVMRVVSNYATLGLNAASHRIKQLNRRVSREAYELLLRAKDFDQWSKATINEHELLLAEVWSRTPGLTPKTLWKIFVDHQLTTVTSDEDRNLPKSGERDAGIEVSWLEQTPREIYETLRVNNSEYERRKDRSL